jgi:hypothetical protein
MPTFAHLKRILNLCAWHMFEEKREAVLAVETAVLPLMA